MRIIGGARRGLKLADVANLGPGEAEQAIAAANEVTAPNSDDGLALVLERWWL
jgi:hydroxymethylpyrimidine pyrophosphatase-like HAD family hydrolase